MIRVWNNDVLSRMEAVLELLLLSFALSTSPPPHPSPSPILL
ncbi:hypothetical protein [Aeromonas caviae]|nr:hypothetical protein [Aeromonas caviae]